MDWNSLLTSLGLGTLIIGGVTFLLKSYTKYFFDGKLSSHEIELNAQNEREFARFSKLHEKRAGVIENLYELIVDSSFLVKSFLSPLHIPGEPSKEEKGKEAFKKLSEMKDFYDKNRIFFGEDICKVIDGFIKVIREPTYKFKNVLHFGSYQNIKLHEILTDTWFESWDKYETKVQPAKKKLENEFRKILGVK